MILGTVYGVSARFLAENHRFGDAFVVMTWSFLFLVPLAIGVLTVKPVEKASRKYRIFAPWLPLLLSVAVAALAAWEGAICIVMSLPLLLLLSSIGGLLTRTAASRSRGGTLAFVVLPFAVAPIESKLPEPRVLQKNVTAITIDAPLPVVWQHVTRVDSIREAEHRPALFTAIGFPRPIDATLSRPGIGGVRHARFDGNVLFVETVTEWEDERKLSFTIDPASIPAKTLDPHVTIGGPFFDVLNGTYELERTASGHTLVVLTSEHRISTRFNPYAGLWAGAIMRSVQNNILYVIRDRAERAAGASSPGEV